MSSGLLKYMVCALFNHPTPMSRDLEEQAIKTARELKLEAGARGEQVELAANCYCGRVWWPIDPEWKR